MALPSFPFTGLWPSLRHGLRLRLQAIGAFRPWPALLAERERWFLWLPVLLGLGIALYFLLPKAPAAMPLRILVTLGLVLLLGLIWRRPVWAVAFAPLVLLLGGLWLAAERAEDVAAPVLQRRLPASWIEGRVLLVEPRDHGHRLTIDQAWIEKLEPEATPARLRVTLRQGGEDLRPGERVRLRAMLGPPSGPVMPGAFDFARTAWFQRIGAIGTANGAVEILPPLPASSLDAWGDAWRIGLANAQQRLTERILAALDGADGAIAAALMTGVRGPIPEEIDDAFRDSGLAHILSISGLHLALVSGILFAAIRGLLALLPYAALHWPIKKIAAVAALIGAAAYMLISGSALATQRSFLMVALALGAVLLDRQALSLRSLALAALLLLLLAPESLLDAGFQMSFGAVAALIASYEALEQPLARWRAQAGPLRMAGFWLAGVLLSSFVAGIGSGLFAAYHFNRFADYALIANLIASPLVSFWIMPLAMLAFALMPFGLEALALVPMGWGVEGLIAIAVWVAGWPGAVATIPAMPAWSLGAMAIGGLWLCLWRLPWRWLGLLPICAGLASPLFTPLPDLLISGDARRIALRGGNDADRYYFSSPANLPANAAPRGFEAETWWRRLGAPALLPWPNARRNAATGADGSLRCEPEGCTARVKGWVIALPREERALAEDCRRADIVVAPFPIRGRCAGARLVIDRFDLWREGAHALYLHDDGRFSLRKVAAERGLKPWSPPRGHGAANAVQQGRGEGAVLMDDLGDSTP